MDPRGSIGTPAGDVSVLIEGPQRRPVLVLAHGAGGNMESEFMGFVAAELARAGIQVWRFNFAYSEAGRKSPDRAPILEQTFAAVVEEARAEADSGLFLGGKSMGGRIASQIAAAGTKSDGLVFFGYPLHPPGRPERLRDEHLPKIEAPMLFIEGTRDPFCPLETLRAVLRKRKVVAEVAVIDDGDHSFKVRAASGRKTSEAWREVVDVAAAWMKAR